jgi:hypothetical protein
MARRHYPAKVFVKAEELLSQDPPATAAQIAFTLEQEADNLGVPQRASTSKRDRRTPSEAAVAGWIRTGVIRAQHDLRPWTLGDLDFTPDDVRLLLPVVKYLLGSYPEGDRVRAAQKGLHRLPTETAKWVVRLAMIDPTIEPGDLIDFAVMVQGSPETQAFIEAHLAGIDVGIPTSNKWRASE